MYSMFRNLHRTIYLNIILFDYCQLLKTLGPQSETGPPQLGNKSGTVINVNGFQWNTPLHLPGTHNIELLHNWLITLFP